MTRPELLAGTVVFGAVAGIIWAIVFVLHPSWTHGLPALSALMLSGAAFLRLRQGPR